MLMIYNYKNYNVIYQKRFEVFQLILMIYNLKNKK